MATQGRRSKLKLFALVFMGIVAFVAAGILIEQETGLPFDTTFRIACAAGCLFVIAHYARRMPGEHWPWIGFWLALLVNGALFFTPLLHGRLSRGEIMLFAVPDAVVMLAARVATFRPADEHDRAVRQQLVVGLAFALLFLGLYFGLLLLAHRGR